MYAIRSYYGTEAQSLEVEVTLERAKTDSDTQSETTNRHFGAIGYRLVV